MQEPALPANEPLRLETLQALDVLDTPAEERFDRVTRMARRIFNVPISLVSLVDENRQWFKSCLGLSATETPRDISFCGHSILGEDIFVINDARQDDRFADNPLVTGPPDIRFYAGYPLKAANGCKLGTLCIIDQAPRDFPEDDVIALTDLASMVEQELAAVQLATLDELTGISNRRGFLALAQHAVAMCKRQQRPASLVFFDLDGFKQVNDHYGHAEGDQALKVFAELMRDCFRDSDIFARLAGDEFVVLLTNTGIDDAADVIERFEAGVAQYNRQSGKDYQVNFSSGIVAYDGQRHDSIEAFLQDADALMYEDKQRR